MGVRSTRMRLVHDVPNECAYNASSSWQYWRICIVYDPLSLWGRPRLFKIPSPWTFRNFQTGSSTVNSQLNLELLKISSKMYEKLSVLLMFIRFSTDIWTRRVKVSTNIRLGRRLPLTGNIKGAIMTLFPGGKQKNYTKRRQGDEQTSIAPPNQIGALKWCIVYHQKLSMFSIIIILRMWRMCTT